MSTESTSGSVVTIPGVTVWGPEQYRDYDFYRREPGEPLLLKGYVEHWPAVQQARQSPQALAHYLLGFDAGQPLEAMIADPREQGRLFYREDLSQFNFTRMRGFLPDALDILASQSRQRHPAAFYVGSTAIPEFFPGLERDCRVPGLPAEVSPNLWLGNATLVATHNDLARNIACVASGRRRFTLFPPEQEPDLYIADQPKTPGGRPVSRVNLRRPDLSRFPRFERALARARVADLEPGDALYMPFRWWHNVESFGPLNLLVNFWWGR